MCHAQDLSPYQHSHKLKELPSPLAYLSYLFNFGNLLAGEQADETALLHMVALPESKQRQSSDNIVRNCLSCRPAASLQGHQA